MDIRQFDFAVNFAANYSRVGHDTAEVGGENSVVSRQVDKAATSVILNIAEGYGRTGGGDRLRFLEIAETSAVRAAAYRASAKRDWMRSKDQREQNYWAASY